jgi:hypothetical protein
MRAVFTTADGETAECPIVDDSLLLPAVSFLSAVEGDTSAVWENGEESRLIVPVRFSAFADALASTVFHGVLEAGVASGAAVTPDGKVIALRATTGAAGTAVQIAAPTLELLALADDFCRRLK